MFLTGIIVSEMNSINDIGNERIKDLSSMTLNNDSDIEPVKRSDKDNEAIADYLVEKLSAPESRLAFLAAANSGLPRGFLVDTASKAKDMGSNPPALFMHIIGQQKQWQEYKAKKDARKAEGLANGS